MVPNYLKPGQEVFSLHLSYPLLSITRATNIPTRRPTLVTAQPTPAVIPTPRTARSRAITAARSRTRRVVGPDGLGPGFLFLAGGEAHDAEYVFRKAHRALVRHAVFGEVECLCFVACFVQGGLVEVVVVVDEAAVGHVPGVGAVPPGRELVSVPGISVSSQVFLFRRITFCSTSVGGLTRQDQ